MDKIKIPKATFERFKRLRVADSIMEGYEIDDSLKHEEDDFKEVNIKTPWDGDSNE